MNTTKPDEHQETRRKIAGICRNEECAVLIRFDTTAMTTEQREALATAETCLRRAGIGFDIGACCDAEVAWSLKGPVKVLFRNFIKDDPKNRYVRSNQEVGK